MLLAAFATKAAVCVLARGFAGSEVLVYVGTGMALVGVTFALLQDEGLALALVTGPAARS